MILITGGTGFIGRALIRQLMETGQQVRTLVRPSAETPRLPKGVAVEVTVCSLKDERGLRAAMKGVDTVFHLASSEHYGSRADLLGVDIQGTQAVVGAAADAGVSRMIYVSHLGADRASAFPVLKAKAIAENIIRTSGVPYTIIRSAVAYGPGDRFTIPLAVMIHSIPAVFIQPGDGATLIQPIWVEDLVTSLVWSLEDASKINQLYSIGGPEYLTLRQVLDTILRVIHKRRMLLPFPPAYLRGLTVYMEHNYPQFPASVLWLDDLAVDRTCPVDTLPREFGLLPAPFSQRLDYLHDIDWRKHASVYLSRKKMAEVRL